jgi:beta-phosphoglucomutase-like phosphatase (HAD superfamily)
VFLLGAQGLQVTPQNCVVIEDAAAGVAAAHNAGMKAVGFVSTGRTAAELSDADLVITSLRELSPQRLSDLIQSKS